MDKYNPMPPANLTDETYRPMKYSFVGFEGFLNAKLLVEILKRMGNNLDKSYIKELVEGINSLDIGIDSSVSFGPNKHQGLDKVYFTTFQDGRFVPIKDWKRWRK
jgi:branched-chain amino acid transport system substrate-binding protein